MRRFRVGDLAVTVNSKAPLLNNGHVVVIRRILGPVPEHEQTFAYSVERIDGQAFPLCRSFPDRIPMAGGRRVTADQSQLRPTVEIALTREKEKLGRTTKLPQLMLSAERPATLEPNLAPEVVQRIREEIFQRMKDREKLN